MRVAGAEELFPLLDLPTLADESSKNAALDSGEIHPEQTEAGARAQDRSQRVADNPHDRSELSNALGIAAENGGEFLGDVLPF